MERRTFVVIVAASVLGAAAGASAQGAAPVPPDQRPRWGQQAESEFRLGRGLGPRLMTEEEWREHQEKMRTMSAEERARYREEVHQRMMDRAKEQGMATPRMPDGMGPGSGSGPGTGSGSGMGPGPGPGGGMGPRGGRGR